MKRITKYTQDGRRVSFNEDGSDYKSVTSERVRIVDGRMTIKDEYGCVYTLNDNEEWIDETGRNTGRICTVCGHIMCEGYMFHYQDYACTVECAKKLYRDIYGESEESLKNDLETDEDECFYTCWL